MLMAMEDEDMKMETKMISMAIGNPSCPIF